MIQEVARIIELGARLEDEKRNCHHEVSNECEKPSSAKAEDESPNKSNECSRPADGVSEEILFEQSESTPRRRVHEIDCSYSENHESSGDANRDSERSLVERRKQEPRRARQRVTGFDPFRWIRHSFT